MLEASSIDTPTAAFVAGLITSIHCVGMCGPFACALTPRPDEKVGAHTVAAAYHGMRILSYTAVGALLGGVGQAALGFFSESFVRFAPWMIVLFFVSLAFRIDRWLPKPKFLTRLVFKGAGKAQKLPRAATGAALGAATPFLPCGPLYIVFAVALTLGSPVRGAEFLLAFGLGTAPLLWLAQSQYMRLRMKLSPVWMMRIQRGLALGMAVLAAWRLALAPQALEAIESSDDGSQPAPPCPMCVFDNGEKETEPAAAPSEENESGCCSGSEKKTAAPCCSGGEGDSGIRDGK